MAASLHRMGATSTRGGIMGTSFVRRAIGPAGVLVASTALLLPLAPAASATKPQSAPVFSSKAIAKAKQGKAFTFTVKTKANPTADVSLTGALPPGMTFTDNHNGTATLTDPTPLAGSYSIGLQATNTTTQLNTTSQTLALTATSKLPLVRHVFVIMFENVDYSATFGNPTADPYLAQTLPSQGALLQHYYGIGHFSNDNYAGFISGQPPNTANQLDCISSGFSDFLGGSGQSAGIQQGAGCVYPTAVTTLANQLDGDGLTWKGYQEDMGNDAVRDNGVTCAHPVVGSSDPTTTAEAADGYTTRHNPFAYFHSIIDNTVRCNQNVVPVGDTGGAMPAGTPAGVTGLTTDLASIATTPNFSFITPNLCDDGHDATCINTTGAGQGGGSAVGDINKWLQTWVPIIEASPAYQQDGLIEITGDEAENPTLDSTACCGETVGPAANAGGNGITGPGGGVVGATLLSPFITPGTVVTKSSYNHYSSLASIEDLFGLPRLGEASSVTSTFDKGIFIK
jgi:hypothetical protein